MLELAKKQHSAFSKANNGKIYCNVDIWINEEPDKFGNHAGIKAHPKKDSQDEKKFIGNAKWQERKEEAAVSKEDVNDLPADDDLPF